jgi:hypothetical protein
LLLERVHTGFSSSVNNTLSITAEDVLWLGTIVLDQLHASDTSSSSSIADNFELGNVFSRDFHSIDQTSEANDGSSVLIIVENWNWHHTLKSFFNVEAVRTLDIFEVNTSERWMKILDNCDKLIWILAIDAEINAINISKFLEKD